MPTPTTQYMTKYMCTVWHVHEVMGVGDLACEGYGGLLRALHVVALWVVCGVVKVWELEVVR